jgi:predicted nucleotidyltransferase
MAVDFEAVREAARNFSNDAKQVFPIRKTYLFGSYAKGTADEQSDVDICFFLDSYQEKNRYEIITKLLGICRKYNEAPFDPIVFQTSEIERGNPFVKDILSTGQELV